MARPALRRRRYGWVVWVLVAVGVVLGARRYASSRVAPSLPVRAHRVAEGRVRDLVSTVAAGRVAARREATIRAEIAGRVARLAHRRGDRVESGEALVAYDTSELRDRVRVAEAAIFVGRAQAAQAEASARLAATNAARARALAGRGVTPAAEADTLGGQADVAQRAVDAARISLRQASANVALARGALIRAVVRAPFAGTVLTTSIEEGEVTAPGAPLLTLADTTELHVDAELDEADLGRVEVGMPAEVALDAFPQQRFSGRLAEIAPSVTRDARGNRAVAIRVNLDPDRRLRVGMSADVDVVVATRERTLWVPPNAVMGRGTDRAVYVVENGVARRRAIDVGIATWEAVEVRRGLRAGEQVIVTLSVPELSDGSRVAVQAGEARGNAAAPAR